MYKYIGALHYKTADDYLGQIQHGWMRKTEGVLRTAEIVAAAWKELGEKEREGLDSYFGEKQCRRLKKIARFRPFYRDEVITVLPYSIGTLEELSRLTAKEFDQAFTDGLILRGMTRSKAIEIRTGRKFVPIQDRFPGTRKFISIRVDGTKMSEDLLDSLQQTLESEIQKFKESNGVDGIYIDNVS